MILCNAGILPPAAGMAAVQEQYPMPRSEPNAVYNAPVPHMVMFQSRFLRTASCLLVVLILLGGASASDWRAPAEQLARKIVAATGPGAVAVDVTNRSSLSKGDSDEIRRQLLTQLAAMGVRFVSAEQAAATVRISLSENLESYVWVAEIHQGVNESSTIMVSAPRPADAPPVREAATLALHKTLLWSQQDRILDATMVEGSPAHLIVLDPSNVTLYRFQDSRWQTEQILSIAHSRPWPRDMRGHLILRKDHLFDAYLPGVFCQSSGTAPLSMKCRDSDDPWPLGADSLNLAAFFTPARNFFTGVLAPGIGKQTTAPAFYSAAALPREKYTLWLFAAVDGQVHMLDGVTDLTIGRLGWGSDIASLHTGCGLGWQVLVSVAGDGPTDAVRAFEIADREPAPASAPLEFAGSLTALWTGADGSVTAVTHNSETGEYEAFRLTISCNQ